MLTVKRIARLTTPGRYLDGRGLYLQVMSPTNRSWLLRWEQHGRDRWLGLGPLADFSLEEARARAHKARQLIKDGIDPISERKKARAAAALDAARQMTFREAARQYHALHEASWKSRKTRREFLAMLERHAFKKIGALSVADIDTGRVLAVIEALWTTQPILANRIRGRIEKILEWSTIRGYRSGDNPAAWRNHLRAALPAVGKISKVEHLAALPYAELPAFLTALRTHSGVGVAALEFLILTAARTGEVIRATWSEFDLQEKVWTIPAERMKAAKAHRVPLADRAMAILGALPREAEYVFIGARKGQHISDVAMIKLVRRMGHSDIAVHGFRATFKTWASERTAYPDPLVEMCLAHAVGNAVEAAYRRTDLLDKRRRLMAEWATYCTTPTPVAGEVVALRGVPR